METKHLKKYAPEARRDFIAAVKNKAAVYGLLPKEILPMQEEGDVVVIGDRPFPRSVAKQRKELESRIAREGFQSFIEAVAYTWFNRLVAIRFMEVRGYLSHGYRVLSHPSGDSLPEVMEYAERLDLPGLDRDAIIDLKLDGQKDQSLYQMLLLAQCNELHAMMPFMFEKVSDATELLLPDNLLHSESLIRRLVAGLPPESMEDIEAVGWLYQFYISEKKDDVFAALKKGKKITPENIPAATQLFTPHWIVRYLVENSLGRLWMLNHPDSRLIEEMDYYIKPEEPETDFLRISSPEEIKICDPACGSGHMLTYAFDLLYAIYEEQGYQATDIPRLILTHNLYGIEIDQRAGALAAFALTMKAREKYRRFLTGGKVVQPNICVLENISIDPEDLSAYMAKVGRDLFSGGLQGVVNQWEEADNFGSLIRPLVTDVSEVLELLRERQMGEDLFLAGVHQKVLKALRQADYLSPKYHVVVANPPYMSEKGMDAVTKPFVVANYEDAKGDLFACFIERSLDLLVESGLSSMVTMQVWLFVSAYEQLRKKLLARASFTTLVQIGFNSFPELNSKFALATAAVIKNKPESVPRTICVNLNDAPHSANKNHVLLEKLSAGKVHSVSFSSLLPLPGSPFAYWLPQKSITVFASLNRVGDYADAKSGQNTGDNDRFVKMWFEVARSQIGSDYSTLDDTESGKHRWFPYNKGGKFRKWYGNREHVIDWHNNGFEVKEFAVERNKGKHWSRYIQNLHYMMREGVTWTFIGYNFSARYSSQGFLFDYAGCSLFPKNRLRVPFFLGLINSNAATHFLGALNQSLNYQPGNIADIPCPDPDEADQTNDIEAVVKEAIEVSRADWDSIETSMDFVSHPLLMHERSSDLQLSDVFETFSRKVNSAALKLHQLEEENNRLFNALYGLQDELQFSVSMDKVLLSSSEDAEVNAQSFISYAVGCMLGRYSLDQPGLILANQGETADDYRQRIPEPTFAPDEDNVIPLLDGDWFEDDITERFKAFLKVTFGTEHYEENLTFLENALYPDNLTGKKRKTIRDYCLKEFYNHHIKLYKKRPIYWLFSSGKQGAFRALIYMHRYTPSTLSRMRTEYVVPLQGKFNARIEQLESDIPAAGSTSHRKKLESERTTLIKKREEIQTFDEKLRHYADQRIEIDLDDGVKVNYGKFGDLLAEVKAITGKKPEVEVTT